MDRKKINTSLRCLAVPLGVNLATLGFYGYLLVGWEGLSPTVSMSAALLAVPLYIVLQIVAMQILGGGFLVIAPIPIMALILGSAAISMAGESHLTGLFLFLASPLVTMYVATVSTIGMLIRLFLDEQPGVSN